MDAFGGSDEGLGGAEDADKLGGQEVVKESLPACAVMEKSSLADGVLDFFRWRGHWWDRAFGGGESGEALVGALPLGIQHSEPFAGDVGWNRWGGGDFFGTEFDVVGVVVNGGEVSILQIGHPFVEWDFKVVANAAAFGLGRSREVLVGEVQNAVALILEQNAVLEHFFLSIKRPLQHVPAREPGFIFCSLLDAAEDGSWVAGNGENFCVREALKDFGKVAYQQGALLSTVDGLLAVCVGFVKIFGAMEILGRFLGIGGKSVTEEKFSPRVGIFQPSLPEKQTLRQVVTLQLRLIHQRDRGMLVQAGVKHRCAGAEDACDEEILGSLAGGHAGKEMCDFWTVG